MADALLERGVVGGERLGGVAVVLTMGVAELAEQVAEAAVADREPSQIWSRAGEQAVPAPPDGRLVVLDVA